MDIEFNLYTVSTKYVRNLKNVEKKATGRTNTILSNSPQTGKHKRPFLGIITVVNGQKYCIPLSTYEGKDKYKNISENITCRKIKDCDGKVIGILNINNMIPVKEEYITIFKLEITEKDTEEQINYKELCKSQLKWCRDNKDEICKLATDLHRIINTNQKFKKRNICPDYGVLEKECNKEKLIPKHKMRKKE